MVGKGRVPDPMSILSQGVQIWNKWRNQNQTKQVSLMSKYLADGDYKGADFRNCNLGGVNFSNSNLENANLCGADLSGSILDGARLYKANLSKAILDRAMLKGALIDEHTIMEPKWKRVWNIYKGHSDSDLKNVDLSSAYLVGVNLSGFDLSGANLCGADLRGADLTHADLRDVITDELTRMDSKWFFIVLIVNGEINSDSNLQGQDLSKACLKGVNLQNLRLEKANFSESDLTNASLCNSIFTQSNFSKSNLSYTFLRKANLGGANLSDANLSNADFEGAILSGAILNGANLNGTNLCHVDADYSIVDGLTLLRNCKIDSRSNFTGVGLDAARIDGDLKARLNRNIRRSYWEQKYLNWRNLHSDEIKLLVLLLHKICGWSIFRHLYTVQYKALRLLKSSLLYAYIVISENKLFKILRSLLYLVSVKLVKFFWWMSDYGSSTTRIMGVFFGFVFLFAFLYLLPTESPSWAFWPTPLDTPFLEGLDKYSCNINSKKLSFFQEEVIYIGNCTTKSFALFGRSLYFSVVTMTTLGFGDIYAHPSSLLGHVMVISQVFIGYLLLGALITRLSILFQNVD